MDERRVSRFFEHTRYRTNYYSDRDRIINGGIDRSFIERRGGFRIPEREIRTVDNFRDYDRNRNDRNGRIIAYRPSASEINNTRTRENFEIKRGENRPSLERDKIRLPMDNKRSGIFSDGVNERTRDAEINRGTQPNRGDRSGIENRNNIRNEERVQKNMNREQPKINQAPNSERRSSMSERRIEQRGNRGTEKYSQQRDRNNQRYTPRQQRSSKSEKDTKKDDSRQK
jgi:hypothetical protein